ncbi:hypothetical protein [Uliginosibacterium sp. H1]|uniref:hypothetical protein n=1 Tax=Uliginosibacterium sp. H1 TaxID=3114757 RepID=UPI002E182A40|nr:hypothetical protein [Uliginosibacterium sp. H1]
MTNAVHDRTSPAYVAPPIGAANDLAVSGTSWGAIMAGAAGAAALSLILLTLGFGLGLSAVSPWENEGISAKAIGVSTVVWLAFTQIAASGIGGYLAGRLRVRWSSVQADEVYFRDTAHGFLAWSVATLVTATFLTGTITAVLGTTAPAAAAGAAVTAEQLGESLDYNVDAALRRDLRTQPLDPAVRAEVLRIYANGVQGNVDLPAEDRRYLVSVVTAQTGLPPAEAERRVDGSYSLARQTAADLQRKTQEVADATRAAAAKTALWSFVALLCGAFFASLMAIYGGRQRDL